MDQSLASSYIHRPLFEFCEYGLHNTRDGFPALAEYQPDIFCGTSLNLCELIVERYLQKQRVMISKAGNEPSSNANQPLLRITRDPQVSWRQGLPDVAQTRPCSRINMDKRQDEVWKLSANQLAQTLVTSD